MPVEFNHDSFRALAKRLKHRLQTSDDIKHTDILEDMAAVLGYRPDALMHALKSERERGRALSPEQAFIQHHLAAAFKPWDTLDTVLKSVTNAVVGVFGVDGLLKVSERHGPDALKAVITTFTEEITSLSRREQIPVWIVGVDALALVAQVNDGDAMDHFEKLFASVTTEAPGPRYPIKMTMSGGIAPLTSPRGLEAALESAEALMRNLQHFRSGQAKHMWSDALRE